MSWLSMNGVLVCLYYSVSPVDFKIGGIYSLRWDTRLIDNIKLRSNIIEADCDIHCTHDKQLKHVRRSKLYHFRNKSIWLSMLIMFDFFHGTNKRKYCFHNILCAFLRLSFLLLNFLFKSDCRCHLKQSRQ